MARGTGLSGWKSLLLRVLGITTPVDFYKWTIWPQCSEGLDSLMQCSWYLFVVQWGGAGKPITGWQIYDQDWSAVSRLAIHIGWVLVSCVPIGGWLGALMSARPRLLIGWYYLQLPRCDSFGRHVSRQCSAWPYRLKRRNVRCHGRLSVCRFRASLRL